MSLDAPTTRFLRRVGEAGGKPLDEMTPREARDRRRRLAKLYGRGPDIAHVEDVSLQGEDGGSFTVRVLRPTETPRGAIVYYHGGGWVVGGIDEFDAVARELAHRTDCTVVSVDYRLAPEHPFPIATRDAYVALRWTAEGLGRGLPVIVAGDSAGGNLAAVVARRGRDEGGPAIACQVLVYPVTDCDLNSACYTDPSNQLMLTRGSMVWYWNHYLPDPALRTDPDASPLRAADLSGLPPAVVLTAEHDVLRDEGESYAARLREAGVPVELTRCEGQMHGFLPMIDVLPGSAEALATVATAIDKVLG